MTELVPQILARGPWAVDHVRATWSEEPFQAPPERLAAADAAIAQLKARSSPSHDGWAARLVSHRAENGTLELALQPTRWSLRLVAEHASESLAALCVTRDAQGRWLAGRRAPWLSSWAGRWALGAGGAVDVDENPADTLARELNEEWAVAPERTTVEALVRLPRDMIMLVGMAWLPDGAEVVRDHEHDAHAWWPADVERWPAEADENLRRMGRWLSSS